jgi:pyruvate/2-oxoglutarate dehydrogenase complex dihydrolipoamide acyltransferase (E2) component
MPRISDASLRERLAHLTGSWDENAAANSTAVMRAIDSAISLQEQEPDRLDPNDQRVLALLKKARDAQRTDEADERAMEEYARKYSASERRQLATEKKALSDGSYPIANKEDLKNALILARSGHGNVSAAMALIRRRAKELGVNLSEKSAIGTLMSQVCSSCEGSTICGACEGTGLNSVAPE